MTEKPRQSSPLVSVIVPVYKVEPYLRRCADSILSQTFRDFELILVDDGSPDGCGAICDGYAAGDGRVRVIHKKNGGLSDARNAGIGAAAGEYLMFVDGDDCLVSRSCMAELAGEIQRTKYKLYFLNHTVSEMPVSLRKFPHGSTPRNRFIRRLLYNKYKRPYAWAWAAKRDFILEKQLFFMSGILHEDEEWLPRLLLALDKNDRIFVFNDYFYFYRLNREGAITSVIREKNIRDKLFIIEKLRTAAESRRGIERKFLYTRAAQIMMNILILGKTFLKTNTQYYNEVHGKLIYLKDSCKMTHKIFYIAKRTGVL